MPKILTMKAKDDLAKVKFEADFETYLNNVNQQMQAEFKALEAA